MGEEKVACYELKPGLLREKDSTTLRIYPAQIRLAAQEFFAEPRLALLSDSEVVEAAAMAVYDTLLEKGYDEIWTFLCEACKCWHAFALIEGRRVEYRDE